MGNLCNLAPLVDLCVLKCIKRNSVFYLMNIYIPPDTDNDDLDTLLSALSLRFLNTSIIIVGDFNTHHQDFNIPATDPRSEVLQSFFYTLNLRQYNSIRNFSNRTLDLVLTNMNCKLTVDREHSPMIPEDVYHPALIISFSLNFTPDAPTFPSNYNRRYNFKKADFHGLYQHFFQTDWFFLENIKTTNEAVDAFYTMFYSILDLYVPICTSSKKKYPTWFTSKVKHTLKLKNYYFRKWKETNAQHYRSEYTRLRAEAKKDINIAYKTYVAHLESNIASDPKAFWQHVQAKKNCSRIPGCMKDGDNEYVDPTDIVNMFSREFAKSFNSDALASPPFTNHQPCLKIGPFSEDSVTTSMKSLKANMVSGDDGIPSFLVKDLSIVLSNPLTIIYNLSLRTNTFPNAWKKIKITPVLKKGDPSIFSNYRPISLLSNFAKIFDQLIYKELYARIHGYLSVYQNGFIGGRSTVTNLLSITQLISTTLDDRGQIDIIYTDFSRAFDTINHRLLLTKLDLFGCCPNLIKFFDSYLSNRTAFVSHNGFNSVPICITSGVPQGSNLGPLLFNIYINDLLISLKSNVLGYADDLKIFNRIDTEDDCDKLSTRLLLIAEWCSNNGLHLNVNKCNVVTYSRRSRPLIYNYAIDSHLLHRTNSVKDLGVIFDSKLSFDEHILNLRKSASKTLGFVIRQSREFSNVEVIVTLYTTYVRSLLEYAALVWYPFYIYQNLWLEKIQKKFLKYLSFRIDKVYPARGADYESLLIRHDFKSLHQRRELQSAVFIWKLVNSRIDCQDLLGKVCFSVPQRHSRSSTTFWTPRVRTNIGLKAPITHLSKSANTLIDDPFIQVNV